MFAHPLKYAALLPARQKQADWLLVSAVAGNCAGQAGIDIHAKELSFLNCDLYPVGQLTR